MRRGQFGFGDPAEREIQILFRNAVSPGSGPTNQDRQTGLDCVSDWGGGGGQGHTLVSEARSVGSDPRLGRASSPRPRGAHPPTTPLENPKGEVE